MSSEDFNEGDCDFLIDDELFSNLAPGDHEYGVDQQIHPVETTNNSAAGSETVQPSRSVNVAGEVLRLERKRKNDQAYRQRCKEKKKKIEEELTALRKQNEALQKKAEKFELKPDVDRQNYGRSYSGTPEVRPAATILKKPEYHHLQRKKEEESASRERDRREVGEQGTIEVLEEMREAERRSREAGAAAKL